MCIEVLFKDGKSGQDNLVHSQYEFTKRLGIKLSRQVLSEGYTDRDMRGNSCLCPIDVEKTLRNAGYSCERCTSDSMRVIARRENAA